METSRKRAAEDDLAEPLIDRDLLKKRARTQYGEDTEYNNPDCIYGPDEKEIDMEALQECDKRYRAATNGDLCRESASFTQPGQEIDITDDRASQQYVWDRLPLTAAQKRQLYQMLEPAQAT